ncbi:ZIP family metal transporter [Pelagibacterium xiamenense]|uniref:ZIP family metal transporter n=1 Tax=Pelagibacterium xiamenense TaxID=2901140 RepID=UPI001E633103|nr:ZIP family zinc transporter [Pelagibacterium xiamenense]MCD7061077.1 ZIP family zinc transporter [Pelagibacterium xiamenense]
MPIWVQAGLWALLGASSLVVGAAVVYLADLPRRLTAGIMAFGCGVLLSAVAYDLIMDGFERGGLWPIVAGAIAGALAYTVADHIVSASGGRHRKRSNDRQSAGAAGGAAIAIGSLLDGIPESMVLGVGLLDDGGVSVPMLAAILLSNFPEGLSSAAGMKKAGRGPAQVLGMWVAIAVLLGVSAMVGVALLRYADPWLLAMVNAVAAGALLSMIVDTMIPDAVEDEHSGTGAIVVAGLLLAFAISHGTTVT